MIKIVVINDREPDRSTIHTLLSSQCDFDVVGIGRDGYDALKLVRDLKPDIAIMDANLEFIDGTEIPPLLKHYSPATSIIIFTAHEDEFHIRKAIGNKVNGYLLKGMDMDNLVGSVRVIYGGGLYITPRVVTKAFHMFSEMVRKDGRNSFALPENAETSLPLTLSKKEMRIMAFIAEGRSNKEIAETLSLKIGTVRNYISSAMHKVGLEHRTQIALFALRNGLSSAAEGFKKRISPIRGKHVPRLKGPSY